MIFPLALSYSRLYGVSNSYSSIIRRFFPTKQLDIQKLLDYAKTNNSILKIIVFGSSVTANCKVDSDIDIAVIFSDSSSYSHFFKYLSNNLRSNFDLLDYNAITNVHLKNDIDNKGVVLYDRYAQTQ